MDRSCSLGLGLRAIGIPEWKYNRTAPDRRRAMGVHQLYQDVGINLVISLDERRRLRRREGERKVHCTFSADVIHKKASRSIVRGACNGLSRR